MRRVFLITCCALIFLSGCVFSFDFTSSVSTCETMDDLSFEKREEVKEVSEKFLEHLINNDVDEFIDVTAANFYSESYSKEYTQDYFNLFKQHGEFVEYQLTDIFEVKALNSSTVLCTDNIEIKEDNYFVSVPLGYSYFFVSIHEIRTDQDKVLQYAQYLVKEDGEWKVSNISFHLKEIMGKDSEEYFSIAEREYEKANTLNSFHMYYLSSLLQINNNMITTERLGQIIDRYSLIGLEIGDDLPLNNPIQFQVSEDKTYKVYKIGPATTEEELAIEVGYVTADLNDFIKIRTESRDIATYIKANYPEYEEVFDGLIIQASDKIPKGDELVPVYNTPFYFDEL